MAKKKLLNALFGTKQDHDLKALSPIVTAVQEKESWASSLSASEFPQVTQQFRERVAQGESLDALLPEAFALVREAAKRTLSERHYDVQIMGSIVLHQGKIMEMKTGEGKTLSCVPAAYLNALSGSGVHIVTVNDYLAERDAAWMRPVYEYLGLTVGTIISQLDTEARKKAYSCDITYGTNNEFGFDYLRDNMKWQASDKIQPKHHYCIIDEIDSILIDEARTPLIISGQAEDDTKKIQEASRIVSSLRECEKDPDTDAYPEENPVGDFQLDEKSRRVTFTNKGLDHVEALLLKQGAIKGSLFQDENFEFIHYVTQAVKAQHLYHLDVDYVIQDGMVQIVDEFTGRVLHGRRYSEGLHQAIEAKERIRIAPRNRTLATITFQNFFRMYEKISGMTGTADTEAAEFSKIYGLDVVVIPTNKPIARIDDHDLIYFNEAYKYQAICDEIAEKHATGQPILVGTVTIESSEKLSRLLTQRGIRHEVLNAKNHSREALIISEAGAKGSVTIATNMAGRGTDIKLGGNVEYRARKRCGTEASPEEFKKAYAKELETWRAEYAEVCRVGGLYILGTERHESRRIDNQLRGRSGRQGDPGYSRFYISLDDSLMRLFAKDNLKNLMGRIGMADGEPIYHSMISKAIERAQKRVEERNFEIRKHLLDYDDVLNEQRKFIYTQRDQILMADDLHERALSSVSDMVEELVTETRESFTNPGVSVKRKSSQTPFIRQEDPLSRINAQLLEQFRFDVSGKVFLQSQFDDPKEQKRIISDIVGLIRKDVESKIEKTGKDPFNEFLRYQYLKQIDTRWQDHLERLEELREAVYLRSYAQKNPLLEYKLEGFDIFDVMLYEIKENIARIAVRVQITENTPHKTPRRVGPVSERHQGVEQFGGRAQESGESAASRPAQVQIVRSGEKVGRNDPCPCGSGKKYKHCHGAN